MSETAVWARVRGTSPCPLRAREAQPGIHALYHRLEAGTEARRCASFADYSECGKSVHPAFPMPPQCGLKDKVWAVGGEIVVVSWKHTSSLVQFQRGFLEPRTAPGVYTVVRALPSGADGLQYQVQSDREPYGRIAPEHQLLSVAPPSDTRRRA